VAIGATRHSGVLPGIGQDPRRLSRRVTQMAFTFGGWRSLRVDTKIRRCSTPHNGDREQPGAWLRWRTRLPSFRPEPWPIDSAGWDREPELGQVQPDGWGRAGRRLLPYAERRDTRSPVRHLQTATSSDNRPGPTKACWSRRRSVPHPGRRTRLVRLSAGRPARSGSWA